tara:strand:+ start:1072 stop:2649 length:1578 start_codon:yes stop_codon:yes gene_type:complete
MMIKKVFLLFLFASGVSSQTFSEIAAHKPIWTGSFGTVVIDGDVYNQISMRPEFNYGNWGIGFDLYLYIDGSGKIYDESWKFDSFKNVYRTFLDKFRYIRYGYPGDELYFKVGDLSDVSLGHGILVSDYSNSMQYPSERKIGLQLGKYFSSGIGIEYIQSDFRKMPGLIGSRINYPITPSFDFGVSVVSDINQTGALDDSDGDYVPDFIDDFPDNSEYFRDTDNDGVADELDYDADGDGFDWHQHTDYSDYAAAQEGLNWNSDLPLDPDGEITNQKERITFDDLKESVSGVAIDFTYHINQNFKFYSEFGTLISKCDDCIHPDGEKWNPGYGLTPVGLKGHYGPFSFKMEYRKNSRHFIYNFWDRSYELNRAMVEGDDVVTKSSQLYKYGSLQGVYVNLTGTFLDFVNLGLGYQDLNGEMWVNDTWTTDEHNRSFISTLGLNTSMVPKVKYLNAFYQKTNVRDPFKFADKDENTIFGYNFGIDISESMILVYKARYSYKFDGYDANGNMLYDEVYSMFVETQILF